MAIDSDGNYFKAANLIKDVSKPYLLSIIQNINYINEILKDHIGEYIFNFYTLYSYIPVRDNTDKNIGRNAKKLNIPQSDHFNNCVLSCSRHAQFAMADAFHRSEFISQFCQNPRFSPNGYHFEAIVII